MGDASRISYWLFEAGLVGIAIGIGLCASAVVLHVIVRNVGAPWQ